MRNGIDTEFFVQHIQCTREQKMECLDTVRLLLDIAFTAREFGLLKLEELIQDHVRFSDRFLRKAVNLTIEISKPENIREVLYNYLFTSATPPTSSSSTGSSSPKRWLRWGSRRASTTSLPT